MRTDNTFFSRFIARVRAIAERSFTSGSPLIKNESVSAPTHPTQSGESSISHSSKLPANHSYSSLKHTIIDAMQTLRTHSISVSTDDPQAEIGLITTALARFFRQYTAICSARSLSRTTVTVIAQSSTDLRAFALRCLAIARRWTHRATRPTALKRALVCATAFAIFAQPNLAVAGILNQPTAEELALRRSQALANQSSLISNTATLCT